MPRDEIKVQDNADGFEVESRDHNTEFVIIKKAQFINSTTEKAGDSIGDREDVKAFFEDMGITNMPEDSYVALYRDERQMLLFKVSTDKEKGTATLTDSIDLTPAMKDDGLVDATAVVEEIKNKGLKFKAMDKPIEIPDFKDGRGGDPERDAHNKDALEKLKSNVTLFAANQQFQSGASIASASTTNAGLPINTTSQTTGIV